MPDFNVRSDSVNVEQIMEQIRARIREKRGVDYTEQQIQELAAVKLEKFLDPRGVRSDLLDQFKKHRPRYEPPNVPSFTFEDTTMFETHRGLLRFIRKLLNPILKLFFNPNALIHALHTQAAINSLQLEREEARDEQRRDIDELYFEVVHNLVLELTRTGIEVKNLKMRVESLSSRLEFNERRARALESVVVYKPSDVDSPAEAREPREARAAVPRQDQGFATTTATGSSAGSGPQVHQGNQGGQPGTRPPEGPGQRSRRRRRRRGRRGGAPASGVLGQPGQPGPQTESERASVEQSGQTEYPGDQDPHQATDAAEPADYDVDDGSEPDDEGGHDPGSNHSL
jgi:hypothetical protein